MSLLASMTSDSTIKEDKDSVGGSGPVDSGLYPSKITMAYAIKSAKGALGIVLHLLTEAGKEIRSTIYISSGTDKGCKNYYERDGEKSYLPGFSLMNSLCLLTVGKEISAMPTEDKLVNIYSFDAKADVATSVPVLMELLNQPIIAGVLRQTVDKNVKNDAGVYVPTGETRDENEIDKFFRSRDQLTVAEIKGGATAPGFINQWEAKWAGKTKDKASKNVAVQTGAFGKAAAGTKPTSSIFAAAAPAPDVLEPAAVVPNLFAAQG